LKTDTLTGALTTACVMMAASAGLAVTPQEVVDAAAGDYRQGAMSLHAAPVTLTGAEHALYLELTEENTTEAAQQFIVTFRPDGDDGVTARLHALPPVTGVYLAHDLASLTFGLWAAPDAFPALELTQLDPVADAPVAVEGSSVSFGFTEAAINLEDAMTLDAAFRFAADGATWEVAGVDASGEEVWAQTHGELERIDLDPPVRREDSGLIVVQLRMGEGSALDEGDKVAMHYVGMLEDGSTIDSTRFPGRTVYAGLYPGRLLPGLVEGLRGISSPRSPSQGGPAARALLKVVIPSELGLGEQGNEVIAPGATLYYNMMVESVLDAADRTTPKNAP